MVDSVHVRRQILNWLYNAYKTKSTKYIGLEELSSSLNLSTEEVLTSLRYLADDNKRFVKLRETKAGGTYIYYFAQITATGIDLIEDPKEFNTRFPPSSITQYIAGDNFSVGDNAFDVVIGKNISKTQLGTTSQKLSEIITSTFLESYKNDLDKRTYIDRLIADLQTTINSENVNLGTLQEIKRSMHEIEGGSGQETNALFSHPSIVNVVRKAVFELIGFDD